MPPDPRQLERARSWMQKTVLAELTDSLVLRLRERGYSSATTSRYLRITAHFGQWLGNRRLTATDIDLGLVATFLDRHLPRCRCRIRVDRDRKCVRAGLTQLVTMLREAGVTPNRPDAKLRPEAIQYELDHFEQHLDRVRGAASATRISRRRYVAEFLRWRFGAGPLALAELNAQDLRRFLLERSRTCRPGTVGVIATSLRSYLRQLVLRGYPLEHLIAAVPGAACWSRGRLPQHLTREQEERFLHVPDRSRPSGRRDYAMLLLMCQLGLRVSSVAALTLDAIDWRHGVVSLQRTKSRRIQELPLPTIVENALVAYLRDGRPRSRDRHVFLRHRPPVGRPVSTELTRGVVRRAYHKAGLPASWTGTHRLRHTAAMRMVQGRASIKQIADVLGHSCIDTAAIYAKIDLDTLREVALPWPGRWA